MLIVRMGRRDWIDLSGHYSCIIFYRRRAFYAEAERNARNSHNAAVRRKPNARNISYSDRMFVRIYFWVRNLLGFWGWKN